jgi:cytochrome c oxidase cbb3-type subunit I
LTHPGVAAEPGGGPDPSITFAKRFILISLFYFIAGTTWMGPLSFLLSGPSGNAGSAYDTGRWHLVFIGFVAFAIIGMLYYLAPKLGGRPLYSKRLGTIHFWLTNTLLPIAVLLEVYAALAYQDFINGAASANPSSFPAGLLAVFLLAIILFFVGIGAQVVFAYNIYKTIK